MTKEGLPALSDPFLVRGSERRQTEFPQLDSVISPRPVFNLFRRVNLFLQHTGMILRVAQNSTVLTNPLSMNNAAVATRTAKGTDAPEVSEYRAAPIGRTSMAKTSGYHSICLAIVVNCDSIRRSSVDM